jgi:hypothetical protein
MPSSLLLLDRAATPTEVVSIVRDYFALWSPEEIAALPDTCRPPHLRDATDVEELHRCGVEAFRKSRASGEALALLRKLTGFVAVACVRLAQLRDGRTRPDADPMRPGRRKAGGR